MATLTTQQRKRLKPGQFAGPDRSYPVNDRSHAANAKARAAQAVKAGRMSKAEEAKIDSKADRVLSERGKPRESHERPEHRAKARHGTEKPMLKITSAAERRKRGEEENALPRPKSERMHMGSKGYDERPRAKKPETEPRREREPKKEVRAHERAGEKRMMERKKVDREHERKGEEKHLRQERVVKEHEREGMKKAMGERKPRGQHVYIHHIHHHETKK